MMIDSFLYRHNNRDIILNENNDPKILFESNLVTGLILHLVFQKKMFHND